MASTTKLNLYSSHDFHQQFESSRTQISLAETEETWDTIARSISTLAAACSDTDSYTPAELVAAIRVISRPLISAMSSERSRLSGVAIDFVAIVAGCLGPAFEPLLSSFFPALLALSSRTSKVTVGRARTCIHAIIDATHLPNILFYLSQDINDKSVSLRLTVVESTLACMNCFNPPDLEKESRAKEIEAIVRAAARDANAEVRKISRKVFEAYKLLLPTRLESFAAPLTPVTRKYLEIQPMRATTMDKTKPPRPPLKGTLLSSSTSALRCPPSSKHPPTHTRSASSPAIAIDSGASRNLPPRSRSRAKAEVPARVPEITKPARQAVNVQPRPVAERKRVVSMSAAVRPAIPMAKSGGPERIQPASGPSVAANGRSLPDDDKRQLAQSTTVMARRVPIPEVKAEGEKVNRVGARIDTSKSTPAIRLVAAPMPSVASGSKPAVARAPVGKNALSMTKGLKTKVREATKSNWSKPTLSQLARAKTVEHRIPAPQVPRPQRTQTTRKPASREEPKVVSVPDGKDVTPASKPSLTAGQQLEEITPTTNIDELDARPIAASKMTAETESIEEEPGDGVSQELLATPRKVGNDHFVMSSKTPISELLLSIERGFLFTPSAPLSPPESYLTVARPTNLVIPFALQDLWPSSMERDEEVCESDDKGFHVIRRLESRQALGDVGINK
ncbi:TOG domain-containing protein [Favolaschia claudopus]|uniref:TOG domain-containing protein n=1 Tax=Favolaschia claudopus TaxID=2862362 RepID=A0AAW0E2Q3_9AGAR